MFLLYEHHKDESGEILATDMLLTSAFPGSPAVHFYNPTEKALFNFIKEGVFKQVHTKFRAIDMESCIWSFFPPHGKTVYEQIKASPLSKLLVTFERVEDLVGQRASGFIKRSSVSKIDPADFFYQTEASAAPSGPSKEKIRSELAAYLALPEPALDTLKLSELTRPYRIAALKLHPDRNNGDGSKMSDLNFYWQAWAPYATPEGS